MVTHFRNLRLFVNAGMSFPQCKANAALLNLDAGRLSTTPDPMLVTCKKCLRLRALKTRIAFEKAGK